MAANIAQTKARKALRQKRDGQQRRKLAVVESALAVQARRAAAAPLRHCLMHGPCEGMASIVLAREVAPYRLLTAIFLVDAYCLGIKDVIVQEFGAEEFAAWMLLMDEEAALAPVEPGYARKLLKDAAAWAAAIGFKPHRDFAAAEQLFGDVDAGVCKATFTFGKDGKPLYVPGPTETRAQIRQRLNHLVSRLGEDGFDYADGI